MKPAEQITADELLVLVDRVLDELEQLTAELLLDDEVIQTYSRFIQ